MAVPVPAGVGTSNAGDPSDQLVASLPILDQVGDRDDLEAVLLGELPAARQPLHRAVVVDQLGQHADGLDAREPAQVDGRLGMPRADQHPAVARDQREDVAGADEVLGPDIAVGQGTDGAGALLGGDAGGEPVAVVDRDRECGLQGGVVDAHHRLQPQARGIGSRHRRAQDAAGVAHHERHLLGRGGGGGHDQVALVLAIVIVDDDDHLAAADRLDRRSRWYRARSFLCHASCLKRCLRWQIRRSASSANDSTAVPCPR